MDKNTLYVVFENTKAVREVAFISHCKEDVDLFFQRPSREGSYFYAKITDKDKINRFEKDFADKYCEIEGSVCMTPSEYIYMQNSIPGLVDAILDRISELTRSIQYLTFTDSEVTIVEEMLKICFLCMKSEYDDDDNCEGAFDMELIMERFLNDTGA